MSFLHHTGWCNFGSIIHEPKNIDISLHIHTVHVFASHTYSIDEFCLNIEKDNDQSLAVNAEICKQSVEHSKFKYDFYTMQWEVIHCRFNIGWISMLFIVFDMIL